MPVYGRTKWYWKKPPMVEINEDPPAADTYVTLLDTTRLTKIWYVSAKHNNDENDDRIVQFRITTPLQTLTPGGSTLSDDTWEYLYLDSTSDNYYTSTTLRNLHYWTAAIFRSIKLEMKLTTVGTNEEFDGRCQYATWEPT